MRLTLQQTRHKLSKVHNVTRRTASYLGKCYIAGFAYKERQTLKLGTLKESRHEITYLRVFFPTWSGTNQTIQAQKMARCLKFQILEEVGLYYICSEKQMQLICAFVLAYGKSGFSQNAA